MDSDFSDDDRSRTTGRRTAWTPNGRSNGTNPILQLSTPTAASNLAPTPTKTSNVQSVGLLDPTLSEGRRRKLDAINRLNSLGAQRDLDLPQIVVIGSQSAGKSSLIESISGITLPRASGTCTRCPTECRLINSSEPWQCTVTLRFLTNETGQPLDTVRNIRFGAPIKDRKQVEDRLRRAQQAILNPSIEPKNFLEDHQESENDALAFSANCVSLEITGPDVTDLSFVDLPGLISSVADGGRDEDVEEVKELVSSYIKRPSCIILLTVACESDFETQGAYRLAKQHDKDGTRTIGVLTKPDRIPEGEEARWIKLIKNEISALKNGWYCVKQPSSKELGAGLTFQEARKRGEDFFRKSPWSSLDSTYKKRLGTRAVTLKLNEFLMSVISKRIPEIMEEIQKMVQQTKEELLRLPKPSSQDPVMELMHLIGDFSDELYRQAEGFSHVAPGSLKPDSNLFQKITLAQMTFRRNLRATAPNFRPFNRPAEVDSCTPSRVASPSVPDSSRLRVVDAVSEKPECEHEAPVACPSDHAHLQVNCAYDPDLLGLEEGESFHLLGDVIYHDEVVQLVRDATTRELSGYHPFQVVQKLISRSTNTWTAPALSLIDTIHDIVVKQQYTLIEKYFSHYKESGLAHTVSNIMHEYMQDRRDKAVERVEWLLELESHAFTINTSYFDDHRAKFLAFYRNGRRYRFNFTATVENSKPWDPNQSALEMMATVRAYFHVAYQRIVDTIPLAIDNELVRVRKRGLQEALSLGLKLTEADGREHCRKLLAEPAAVVALREDLESRLQRLGEAQRELFRI